MDEGDILHPAAVDEQGDALAVGARQADRGNEAVDTVIIILGVDLQHLAGDLGVEERSQHLAPVAAAGGLQGSATFLGELEAHLRVGQGVAGDEIIDLAAFGGIGLEEFAPGRYIVEQVLDPHDRPGRRADGRRSPLHHTALNDQAGAGVSSAGAGGDRKAGDRSDRGERLAAEAKRADVEKVLCRGELAGGVPGKGDGELIRRGCRPRCRRPRSASARPPRP